MWKTLAQDYPDHNIVNRGFGGSEIANSTHFIPQIVFPYEPKQIFLRAGGNDIHAGRPPYEVATDFIAFVRKVRERLPNTEIVYVTFNPAPSRWSENDKLKMLNLMIRRLARRMPHVKVLDAYNISLTPDGKARDELFLADKLHFNAEGYKLLADASGRTSWRPSNSPHSRPLSLTPVPPARSRCAAAGQSPHPRPFSLKGRREKAVPLRLAWRSRKDSPGTERAWLCAERFRTVLRVAGRQGLSAVLAGLGGSSEQVVQRVGARAREEDRDGDQKLRQRILHSAFRDVKAIWKVDHKNRAQHHRNDRDSAEPRQNAGQHREAVRELRQSDQVGDRNRQAMWAANPCGPGPPNAPKRMALP